MLLYDGECAFCLRFVRWAEARGADIVAKPCQDNAELLAAHGLGPECCLQAAWFDDGETLHEGAAAINEVLRRIPGLSGLGWRIAALAANNGAVLEAESAVYRFVAANRSRLESQLQELESE